MTPISKKCNLKSSRRKREKRKERVDKQKLLQRTDLEISDDCVAVVGDVGVSFLAVLLVLVSCHFGAHVQNLFDVQGREETVHHHEVTVTSWVSLWLLSQLSSVCQLSTTDK